MAEEKYHKKMLRFARKITPKNWNIFLDHNRRSYKPGVLNISVWILEGEYDSEDEEDEEQEEQEFCGRVKGPMCFSKVSFWTNCPDLNLKRKIQRALKKYGDGVIGSLEIQIFDASLGERIFIHEFAHIAAQRLEAWQQKAYKNDIMMAIPNDEDMHGPLFQKAYRRMIIRAEKVLGKKNMDIKISWAELKLRESGKM